jgi:hypothetical protein
VVAASADHGFIDCPPECGLQLEHGPGLSALLRFPLCGERRVAYCHVQQGRVGDVALLMNERFTIMDWTPGEPRHVHIGNHGSASAEEMMIPLVVAAT